MTTKQLSEVKNLIESAWHVANNKIADFQDTETHSQLLAAEDLAGELKVAYEVVRDTGANIKNLIDLGVIELRFLIESAYNDIEGAVPDIMATEELVYLQRALDIIDEI